MQHYTSCWIYLWIGLLNTVSVFKTNSTSWYNQTKQQDLLSAQDVFFIIFIKYDSSAADLSFDSGVWLQRARGRNAS